MSDLSKFTELELMIGNMFGEARRQEGDLSDDIREWLAIGNVVKNRVLSPKFPNDYKSVILQPEQFSWTNINDPSRDNVIEFLNMKFPARLYQRMRQYSLDILNGDSIDFSYGALYYVAEWLYIKPEGEKASWIDKMIITAVWGGHIFLKEKPNA